MRLKTNTVTQGHIHHPHSTAQTRGKNNPAGSSCLLILRWEAQCKHDCNYHKMERSQWAELRSAEPAILVKSLGKYFLVQVKEFPAGQVSDKVYEARREKRKLCFKNGTQQLSSSSRFGILSPVPENRWSLLPSFLIRQQASDIRSAARTNFQSDL